MRKERKGKERKGKEMNKWVVFVIEGDDCRTDSREEIIIRFESPYQRRINNECPSCGNRDRKELMSHPDGFICLKCDTEPFEQEAYGKFYAKDNLEEMKEFRELKEWQAVLAAIKQIEG